MRFQFLQQDIGRDLEYNVGHKEYSECGIVLRSSRDVEIRFEPEYGRITDIDTVPDINCYGNDISLQRQHGGTYRSRKASRYRTQRHGTMCQSILAKSLRSVVVVRTGRSEGSASMWSSGFNPGPG